MNCDITIDDINKMRFEKGNCTVSLPDLPIYSLENSPKTKDNVIYAIINKINGKPYIGKAESGWAKRWSGYKCEIKKQDKNTRINKAIKKYKIENFGVIFFREFDWHHNLGKLEMVYICLYESHVSKWGYNITGGGDGGMKDVKCSKETRKKLSESQKGNQHCLWHKHTEEHINNFRKSVSTKIQDYVREFLYKNKRSFTIKQISGYIEFSHIQIGGALKRLLHFKEVSRKNKKVWKIKGERPHAYFLNESQRREYENKS